MSASVRRSAARSSSFIFGAANFFGAFSEVPNPKAENLLFAENPLFAAFASATPLSASKARIAASEAAEGAGVVGLEWSAAAMAADVAAGSGVTKGLEGPSLRENADGEKEF